ncbi:MAG: hypothetical protein AB4368_25470 [Xenococcaceae cyanobacterium]
MLVFKLDNWYDLAEEYPPNQHKLASNWENYWQAIASSESVIDWAFKVYVIDRNSCQ